MAPSDSLLQGASLPFTSTNLATAPHSGSAYHTGSPSVIGLSEVGLYLILNSWMHPWPNM